MARLATLIFATFAAISLSSCIFSEPDYVAACEHVTKSFLKSPSGFKRVELKNVEHDGKATAFVRYDAPNAFGNPVRHWVSCEFHRNERGTLELTKLVGDVGDTENDELFKLSAEIALIEWRTLNRGESARGKASSNSSTVASGGETKTTETSDSSAKEIATCSAKKGDLERLACFDDLSARAGLNAPQAIASPSSLSKPGKWIVSHTRNPIDDSETVVLMLDADSGSSRYGEKINFVARCKSKKTEAYINWGTYLGDDSQSVYSDWKYVVVRIGSENANTQRWSTSTDHKATFAPNWAGNLLKQMAAAEKFTVQTTPYGESPVTAVFDTRGMKDALKPLAETCDWTLSD